MITLHISLAKHCSEKVKDSNKFCFALHLNNLTSNFMSRILIKIIAISKVPVNSHFIAYALERERERLAASEVHLLRRWLMLLRAPLVLLQRACLPVPALPSTLLLPFSNNALIQVRNFDYLIINVVAI